MLKKSLTIRCNVHFMKSGYSVQNSFCLYPIILNTENLCTKLTSETKYVLVKSSDAARPPNKSCCIAFCLRGVAIRLSFFELSTFFCGAAAAAAWQYKWLSVCWRLIVGDSLFVEPLAGLIPNDAGPFLCSFLCCQHLPISCFFFTVVIPGNIRFERKQTIRWKLLKWLITIGFGCFI